MPKPLWLMLLIVPLTSGCINAASSSPAPAALSPLIEAMGQRLAIANDVAQSKFYSGKPVQDTERERQVIANAQAQAAAYKLDKSDVRLFMTAQIEANKMVQYARLAQWHADAQPPEQPSTSLTTGIRTRLDTLQPVLMEKYAAFVPYRKDPACQRWVQADIERQTADPTLVTALQRAASNLCATTNKG
ncbi:chorismate mutase [Pseudomonas sp. LP_7_YM]|uniref:chorismate mutase n=1 Tax=Pseudomonas sp. LP_7_YM TaxID=2485137 RepID=UPI0010E2E06E|nr:chorismate mutase [Pseudomonas sp. LP_7_YM]TDV60588.1 chorismate mutase [Pseudomonas sp. LP_7_YM]